MWMYAYHTVLLVRDQVKLQVLQAVCDEVEV